MFLQHYAETLFMIRQEGVDLKGKGICQPNMPVCPPVPDSRIVWKPPPPGWVKLNVDGAFSAEHGIGTIGIIIRDSEGKAILSSWRFVRRRAEVEEVELLACCEGLKLAAEWVPLPVELESDCATVIARLKSKGEDRSRWAFLW